MTTGPKIRSRLEDKCRELGAEMGRLPDDRRLPLVDEFVEQIKDDADAATLALLCALWERASPEAQETFRLHAGQSQLLERAQRLIGEQWDFIQWLANKGKG